MGDEMRDSTADWLLPEDLRPPLATELEARVDEALRTARASEAAVMTVGAAALEAAEQAHRAADLAERASEAVFLRPATAPARPEGPAPGAAGLSEPAEAQSEGTGDESLRDFTARADRVAERLRRLEAPVTAS